MSRVWVIAWREFRATVFTWAFFLSVAVVPLVAIGMSVAFPVLAALSGAFEPQPLRGRALVADTDLVAPLEAEARGDEVLAELQIEAVTGPVDQAFDQVRGGDALAVVHHDALYLGDLKLRDRRALTRWVGRAEARQRVAEAGLDVDEVRDLLREAEPEVVLLLDAGQQSGEEQAAREATELAVAVLAELLLWLGVFVSAQYLLHNTIEERSSKVIEVLLSAVSPMQLMAGKILGLGLVGALLTLAYGSALVAGLVAFASLGLVSPGDLLLFLVFYLLAYLQLGSVFAAIGSAVNDVREAQSLMTPAVVVMTAPFLCLPLMFDQPNGPLAVGLSMVPPLTPFVMIFRVLLPDNTVPFWQIALSLGLSALWAAVLLWSSARVFRVGVLMRGKAPGLLELARWIFER